MKKVLFIFGTRPEAIKMAPLIKLFLKRKDKFKTFICISAQHREMLDQVLEFFQIKADFDLNLMKPNQTLFDITANGLKALEKIIKEIEPDNIFVQGDTTTAFIGALAGYYTKTKVSHLEAGLRSGNKLSPYPEEVNRLLVGDIADFHFAPTQKAVENLISEKKSTKTVWNVGNTVIDALFLTLDLIKESGEKKYQEYFNFLDFSKKIILVTGHRRESFGIPFENICYAMKKLAEKYDEIQFVYPVHLNPNVREPVNRILKNQKNIHLIEPLEYPFLIWLMNQSYFVLTDSGGIQEEAPSLGKPVLVLRDVTERIEGIEAGTAKLVGTDQEKILKEAGLLIHDKTHYETMSKAINPYGDGTTSQKVLDKLMQLL